VNRSRPAPRRAGCSPRSRGKGWPCTSPGTATATSAPLRQLSGPGQVTLLLSRTCPLTGVPEAMPRRQAGHARGKPPAPSAPPSAGPCGVPLVRAGGGRAQRLRRPPARSGEAGIVPPGRRWPPPAPAARIIPHLFPIMGARALARCRAWTPGPV